MKQNMLMLVGLLGYSSIAHAEGEMAQANPMSSILMIGLFIGLFYFMAIRPQSKKAKEHQSLLSNLAVGDEVVTAGGILGKITKVAEQFIVISISDSTEVKIQKQAISIALPKGTIKSI